MIQDVDIDLVPSAESANLQYAISEPIHLADVQPGELLYTSRFREPAWENLPAIQIWRSAHGLQVRIPACGVYELEPDLIRYRPFPHASAEAQRLCLLGTILALWLEWRGILALHAAAVVMDERAVGFLSHSQAGKSTLAAALVKAGWPFLSDDILAVSLSRQGALGHFSYPWMKLWPADLTHFLDGQEPPPSVQTDSAKRLVRVGVGGFGSVCTASRPLACLYLLQRLPASAGGHRVTIQSLPAGQAVMELLRYSFSGPLLRGIGIEAERLEKLAVLVQQVPVRRLIYPAGLEYLSVVQGAIRADLQSQPAPLQG